MNRDSLAVPIAIVLAAGLISGAIYMNGGKSATNTTDNGGKPIAAAKVDIRPVDNTDHVRGNPNAPIMIVEYSDYECPFCKQFHETLNQIMLDYGTDGKVAWVYRQFPLVQLHPNAPKVAEASECVAELGGNDAFWKFSDLWFKNKPLNSGGDMSKLPEYAVTAGADKTAFETCLSSGKMGEKVTASVNEALKTGGRGTPNSIVIVGDQQLVINGAQPYDVVKQMIGNLVKQLEG